MSKKCDVRKKVRTTKM